jgi:hypothetical protein
MGAWGRISTAAGAVFFATTANACAASGGTPDGYVVNLDVHGSLGAFAGRVVVVNGISLETMDGTNASVGLCTTDRHKFLTAPIHVQVFQGNKLLTDTEVNRFACALSMNPGYQEDDTIILQDGGTLLTNFGQDPGTSADCWPPNDPMVCRNGETL